MSDSEFYRLKTTEPPIEPEPTEPPAEPEPTYEPIAYGYDDPFCSWDVYTWEISDGHDSIRGNDLAAAGWDDRVSAVMVPPGYELIMWPYVDKGGPPTVVGGDAYPSDGELVCTYLGSFARQMSDSEFYRL